MDEGEVTRWWWCAVCRRHVIGEDEPGACLHCGAEASMVEGRGTPKDVLDSSPKGLAAPRLFAHLMEEDLDEDEREWVSEINDSFDVIDHYFRITANQVRRTRRMPNGLAGPGQGARELASCYALRTVELLEGASALSESRNAVAVFPVVRALYETWFVSSYANANFRRLVLDEENIDGWITVLGRLLFGRSGAGHQFSYVKPGKMLAEASSSFTRYGQFSKKQLQALRQKAERDYGELSDGSHPTQYGLMPYLKSSDSAAGDDGVSWRRRPALPITMPLRYLGVPIRLLRWELKELLEAADEADDRLEQSFRKTLPSDVLGNDEANE